MENGLVVAKKGGRREVGMAAKEEWEGVFLMERFCISTVVISQATCLVKLHTHTHTHTHTQKHMTLVHAG